MNISINPFDRLRDELCKWQDDMHDCTFWWRDDDLTSDSPSLRRMHRLSEEFVVPALVAVIPAKAETTLGHDTSAMSSLIICQHGYEHRSHEVAGRANSEFPDSRPRLDIEQSVRSGRTALEVLFGERFFPVFVPPWNAFREDMVPSLADWGYVGLSQYGPRVSPSTNGLKRVNAHLDVVDWATAPKFLPGRAEFLIDSLVNVLSKKRRGEVDGDEPIGILTHHRAMQDEAWDFFAELLQTTLAFPSVRWLSPHDIFVH